MSDEARLGCIQAGAYEHQGWNLSDLAFTGQLIVFIDINAEDSGLWTRDLKLGQRLLDELTWPAM